MVRILRTALRRQLPPEETPRYQIFTFPFTPSLLFSAQLQGLELRQKYPSKPPPHDMAEARPTPTPGQPGNAGISLKASLNCQVISSSTASFSKTVIYSKMLTAAKHGGAFWNPFVPSKSSLSLKFLLSPLTHWPRLCPRLPGHDSRTASSMPEVTCERLASRPKWAYFLPGHTTRLHAQSHYGGLWPHA